MTLQTLFFITVVSLVYLLWYCFNFNDEANQDPVTLALCKPLTAPLSNEDEEKHTERDYVKLRLDDNSDVKLGDLINVRDVLELISIDGKFYIKDSGNSEIEITEAIFNILNNRQKTLKKIAERYKNIEKYFDSPVYISL